MEPAYNLSCTLWIKRTTPLRCRGWVVCLIYTVYNSSCKQVAYATVLGKSCVMFIDLKAWFTLAIPSEIFLLLANVIEWMTDKRLRIVYSVKSDSILLCASSLICTDPSETQTRRQNCWCEPQGLSELYAWFTQYNSSCKQVISLSHAAIFGWLFSRLSLRDKSTHSST
jgi:hypothetical protein